MNLHKTFKKVYLDLTKFIYEQQTDILLTKVYNRLAEN